MSEVITTPIATSPTAIMLLSSHCAHCPGVLDSLSKMIKTGDIGELTVINLELNPDAMREYNVRSVPWVKIGEHTLTGAQTLDALKQRAEWAANDLSEKNINNLSTNEKSDHEFKISDIDFLLSDGQVNKVIEAIKQDSTIIQHIMALLGDTGTVLSSRIGIGVVFEEFANTDIISQLTNDLGKLTQHDDVRIRADAYHYLGMTANQAAIPFLKAGKNDKDQENQEIASDSLEELQSA